MQQTPEGSIVNILDESMNVSIIGQFPIVEDEGKRGYYDFVGVVPPVGYDAKNLLFFNKEDITKVLFVGYIDAEFQSFLQKSKAFEEDPQLVKLKTKKFRSDTDEVEV